MVAPVAVIVTPSTDQAELIEALRMRCNRESCATCDLEADAADEIERLQADLDALKQTLAGVKSMHANALEKLQRLQAIVNRLHTPQPLSSWHEEIGNVLWWSYPICEPPFSGEPYDSDWPFDENDPAVYWVPLPDCDAIHEHCEAAEKARAAK
jgi:hypothetical protein